VKGGIERRKPLINKIKCWRKKERKGGIERRKPLDDKIKRLKVRSQKGYKKGRRGIGIKECGNRMWKGGGQEQKSVGIVMYVHNI
jgi:hypothetical protein